MRIACPSCAARYEIADAMLAKPRIVRCSRCAQEWMQDPIPPAEPHIRPPATDDLAATHEIEPTGKLAPETAPETAPEAAVTPVPLPSPVMPEPPEAFLPTRPAAPAAKPTGKAVAIGWIASLVILAGLAVATYAYRVPIQAAWPPSERLFRLLTTEPATNSPPR